MVIYSIIAKILDIKKVYVFINPCGESVIVFGLPYVVRWQTHPTGILYLIYNMQLSQNLRQLLVLFYTHFLHEHLYLLYNTPK